MLFLALSVSNVASAQVVTVIRNVNLRNEPSTVNDPIRLLKPPEQLTLVRSDRDEGYYNVRTSDNLEGYVWAKNVRIEGTAAPAAEEPAVAPMAAPAALPTAPSCSMPKSTKSRWGQKTRKRPANATENTLTVAQMIGWAVPYNLPASARTSDAAIGREADLKVYALAGYVRHVELQTNDCEFHVEVASSRDENAPRVIVEIPQELEDTQRQLMSLVGMKSGGKSRNLSATDAPRLTFVGFAFLDQWHQTNPPTKEGHAHGPAGVVQTLWEIHPVWEVRKQAP